MKIAIIADIHANYKALEGVAGVCEAMDVKTFWFLGDIVGRGPAPKNCIKWLMKRIDQIDREAWLIGNNDVVLLNLLLEGNNQVNSDYKYIFARHLAELQAENQTWEFVQNNFTLTRKNPILKSIDAINCILSHGGLGDYPDYHYLYPWLEREVFAEQVLRAKQLFSVKEPSIIWFGHTHIPTLICIEAQNNIFRFQSIKIIPGVTYNISAGKWWIINPGSVGNSRNFDPSAYFALFDTCTRGLTFQRINYDIGETIRSMEANNYSKEVIQIVATGSFEGMPEEWANHFINIKC